MSCHAMRWSDTVEEQTIQHGPAQACMPIFYFITNSPLIAQEYFNLRHPLDFEEACQIGLNFSLKESILHMY